MNRLPIRLRLTLAFVASVACVLVATGTFVYLRTAADLSAAIDQGLRARAQDLAGSVGTADGALRSSRRSLLDSDEAYAQILRSDGQVAGASTPALERTAVLSTAERQQALTRTLVLDRGPLPGQDALTRALATPVVVRGQPSVLVVGATLGDRADALASLRNQFLVGGPVALLLLALGGYALSRAALRPIDAIRRRAEVLSATRPDERLPVAVANDEVRQLGETLNAMLDRLQDALQRERRLISDAGHELRTPLALLKTELELALQEQSPGDLHTAVRSAIEETDRIAQLSENLLALAQSSGQGNSDSRALDVDVAEVVGVSDRRLRPAFERAGRRLNVTAPEGAWVRVDALQLEQVIGNLLDNALRHGAGATELSVKRDGGRVTLRVRDEGPGVPDEFLPEAFEPFARAAAARSLPGAGLGLAIVRRIAERWGGTATLANHPEGGAEVRVAFPSVDPPRSSAVQELT